ncbi:hypothetical protein COV19_04245 [Candidatus Woesearchaeota archaeon CG10_big_fil_rev_8_21_14_0_10_44_13]|nr:MAG: hypothetical protein COV19_04245 [Candidatus Woesearchaeota archaeon CG10_big_fil_rev_8_21_14_0_10_44_13]
MDIIRQFKGEHIEIKRMLSEIQSSIEDKRIVNMTLAGDFRALKDFLLVHVDLENKLIYSKLKKSEFEELKKLGDMFSVEMIRIAKGLFSFFEKYKDIDISKLRKNMAFNKAFADLVNNVWKRIEIEENMLFPSYSRYYA